MIAVKYRALDDAEITRTLQRLESRIAERFPESGLRKVCKELIAVSDETKECADFLRARHWPIRVGVTAAIIGMLGVVSYLVMKGMQLPPDVKGQADAVQLIDATVSSSVFMGLAVIYLLRIEPWLKRQRALKVVHQLRSLAHVIDMHQLTKDPERLLSPEAATSSPEEVITDPLVLGRYLDYCSELLSVTSKLSALLVQYFNDPVLLGAVDEIETLTTGLSGKIWQKIQLLDSGHGYQPRPRA
jgi:hypothetical protein